MIMTQNEKGLLLKDLCSRLPYGVVIQDKCLVHDDSFLPNKEDDTLIDIDVYSGILITNGGSFYEVDEMKPYLFPFSSMTEKQKDEIRNRFCYEWESDEDVSDLWKHELEFGYALEFIQWCYENHLDIGGLIPKGLAIDATNKNIY